MKNIGDNNTIIIGNNNTIKNCTIGGNLDPNGNTSVYIGNNTRIIGGKFGKLIDKFCRPKQRDAEKTEENVIDTDAIEIDEDEFER